MPTGKWRKTAKKLVISAGFVYVFWQYFIIIEAPPGWTPDTPRNVQAFIDLDSTNRESILTPRNLARAKDFALDILFVVNSAPGNFDLRQVKRSF